MRTVLGFAAAILLVSSRSDANSIVFMEFLNSDLTFGFVQPNQQGRDLSSWSWSHDWFPGPTGYEAQAGALEEQVLLTDDDTIIGSRYRYRGGALAIGFDLQNFGIGEHRTGILVAPIISLEITAGEGDGESAEAVYRFGPGLLDPGIASALGVGRHVTGGSLYSGLLLTSSGNRHGVAGDHDSPERQAWDGYADVTLSVPEPSAPMLGIIVLGGWVWRRRRTHRGKDAANDQK